VTTHGESVTYPGRVGRVRAFLAYPTSDPPWPAVVLIRALLGSVASIDALAHRLAERGYLALAPDHYANDPVVQEVSTNDILKGIQVAVSGELAGALRVASVAERPILERVVAWWETRDDAYVQDLLPAFAYLREQPEVQAESIGVIGFGGGGGLAGRLITTGLAVQVAVLFAGRLPSPEDVASVRSPVLAHYGGEDREAARLPAVEVAMAAHGKDFTSFVYPGGHHLFFDPDQEDYTPGAAALAWDRTWQFLDARLRSQARAAAASTRDRQSEGEGAE
jgi:carboxymethylenebutenolidase